MPGNTNLTKLAALTAIFAGTGAMAGGYAAAFLPGGAPSWAAWLLALGIPASIGGVIVLGAARGNRSARSLTIPILFVVATLAVGFALALALPADESATSTLWLGLPARAAIIIYGIGIFPAIVLPVAYALTFETQTLSDEDVERVVAMGRNKS
jgi:cytochrome bd-type quinol oxidase subunit 2